MKQLAKAFEFLFQKQWRIRSKLANRANPHFSQTRSGAPPDHEQILNRQGPKFCFDFFGEKGDALIRFFQLTCHFRQKLIGADADIDGKAKFCKDALLNGFCGFDWRPKQGFHSRIIQKSFIYAEWLNSVRIFRKNIEHGTRAFGIQRKIGWIGNQIRTFLHCLYNRFTCHNAVFFRGGRFCQNNAVTILYTPANDGGNGA